MFSVVRSCLACKDREPHSESVNRRQNRSQYQEYVRQEVDRYSVLIGDCYDLILGVESREKRESGQGQRAYEHGIHGPLHVLPNAPQLSHVVGIDCVNNGSGAKEEQGFEEGMADEVEHGYTYSQSSNSSSRSQTCHHEAQLGYSRESQHPLDIEGRQAHGGRKQSCESAHCCYCRQPVWRGVEEREHSGHQVDAGGNHRRRMDHGGNGSRTLHGIRKPNMQRELT